MVRKYNQLVFDWYRKPTASGRLINFHSKHDRSIIVNTAKNFVKRVLSISDTIYHSKNIETIKEILKDNGFPTYLIKGYIRDYYTKINTNKTIDHANNKIYKTSTFVPGLSNRMKHSKMYDNEKFQIAFTYNNTVQQIFSNTKSKIDKFEKSDVVYKIPCNGDGSHVCNKVYVGTTKSRLKTRICAHKSNVKNRDNTSENKTALTQHCSETGHAPDLDNVAILQQERHYNKRYTLEMLHIINLRREHRMNFKSDTEKCASAYRQLINNNKHIT